jgi:hypothetical protein
MSIFDQDDPESFGRSLQKTRSLCDRFISLNESEARDLASRLKLQLRIVREDHTALTMDCRPDRVTVDLRTGRVTEAKAG